LLPKSEAHGIDPKTHIAKANIIGPVPALFTFLPVNYLHLRGGDLLCAYEGIMSNFNQLLSDGERDALSNLEVGLRPFFKLRATMPLQYITAFLLVALKEGQTVTELAACAGISASLMTRHLADLGRMNRYHNDGYDLVESELDPMDRRTKRQRLTAKGQRLVGHLLGALTR